jgi:RimJ/RimL family protein N-acetyltransferase
MPGAPETGLGRWPDSGTGEVRIRDVMASDLPVFFLQQRDPAALRMAAFPSRNEKDFVAHWRGILANPHVVKRTIVHGRKIAGNMVGFEQSGKTLVGYWLGREHWGKGVATRALAQFLRIVHRRPVYAFVAKRNGASLRVLQKCGFTIVSEGIGAPDADGAPVEELALVLEAPPPRRGEPASAGAVELVEARKG